MVDGEGDTVLGSASRLSQENTIAGSAAPAGPSRDDRLERGATVGRYVVLDRLGEGGMGVVFAAYDPELDRKVAVKLLRAGTEARGDGLRSRLLREAQAMARLAHPNVIAVHDVGEVGARVFVAMEYVDGVVLGTWLKGHEGTPPPLRAILEVFRAAGRGLVAAHEAGLVHRDFKPENVMIGNDSRVRVLDFGLARAAGAAPERALDEDELLTTASITRSELRANLTVTGSIMGTPAYMAPEQYLGAVADAQSDQFSFCVALWEALYGERPFAGDSVATLALSVTSGTIREPPRDRRVPSWIRRALERGLQVDERARYPSMRALLHALSRDPARRRRRLALAVVSALAIAGGSLVAGRFAFSSGRELCHGADAALAGVWGVKERASLREVFGDFDRRYAENAGALVEAALDGYAGDWAAERVAACRDTHVRGLQTSEVLELRYACLDARLLRMQSLIENLKTLDVAHLEHAVEAARGLPSIAGCRDLATLRLELPPPDDERTRAEVESIRLALEEAKLKDQLGQFAAARAATEALVDRARATAYRPLLAEVLLELSLLQNMLGDRQDAATTREEALWLAEASGHDSVAAQAWIQEVNAAYRSSDFVGAHRALRRADAAIERAGDLAKLRDRYAFERGLLLLSEGKTAEAEAVFRELIDSRRRLFGPEHGDVGRAHSEVAVALMRQGRDGEALVEIEEAARIYNKFFGAGHPELGRVLANRAQALAGLHRSDEAIVALELAQENFVQSLGPEHAWVGSIENNLGLMQNYRDPGRARVHFLRALELLTLTYGETHYQSALVLNNLGGVECMLGDFTAAIAHQRRALEIREELLGPDHLEVSHMLDTLGTTYAAMGALEEATALYERSIALLERIDRADRSDVVYPLVRLASARLSEGRPAEARSLLERAMTIAEGSERIDEAWLAATRYWLAVTLTELAVERDRARSLAEKAFTYYEQPGIHRTRRIHDAAALLARLGDATAMTRLASVAPGDPPPWHACGI